MRPRPSLRSVLAIGALAVFTVWINWRAKVLELGGRWNETPSALMGKPAPDFSLESLDGRHVSLGAYRGKTLAVTFWASWCGPCRLEMPVLVKLYQQNHNSESNFEILAISIDGTRDAAQGGARSLKIPFPVLLDADGHVAASYQVEGIPQLFIVDRGGKVIYSHMGFQMGMDFLLAQQLGIKNYNPMGGKP